VGAQRGRTRRRRRSLRPPPLLAEPGTGTVLHDPQRAMRPTDASDRPGSLKKSADQLDPRRGRAFQWFAAQLEPQDQRFLQQLMNPRWQGKTLLPPPDALPQPRGGTDPQGASSKTRASEEQSSTDTGAIGLPPWPALNPTLPLQLGIPRGHPQQVQLEWNQQQRQQGQGSQEQQQQQQHCTFCRRGVFVSPRRARLCLRIRRGSLDLALWEVVR
jgi:hypothetical protein